MLVPNPTTPPAVWDFPVSTPMRKEWMKATPQLRRRNKGKTGMANITWKLNVSFNAATTAPPSLALINSGVIRGFIGLVTKGLTQYQLKFPGPFSIDFNNSWSDTSYNSSHIPITCRTWRHCTSRNQQGKYSLKILFWGWGKTVNSQKVHQ